MKVINLWGGPGSGKSTTAAGLFSLMKMRGHKVELVTEYAKDLTYSGLWDELARQDHILTEQWQRQTRLRTHVDYVITDSPLPLNIIYASPKFQNHAFYHRVGLCFNEFDNFNIMLHRVKPYSHYGRKESNDEAIRIDEACASLLKDMESSFYYVRGDEDAPVIIYNILVNNYKISLNDT